MASPKITILKYDTNEWSIEIDGVWVGDLMRDKPERYSSSSSSLYAVDRDKPWFYWLSFDKDLGFSQINLKNGIDLKTAKSEARSFVEEMVVPLL